MKRTFLTVALFMTENVVLSIVATLAVLYSACFLFAVKATGGAPKQLPHKFFWFSKKD